MSTRKFVSMPFIDRFQAYRTSFSTIEKFLIKEKVNCLHAHQVAGNHSSEELQLISADIDSIKKKRSLISFESVIFVSDSNWFCYLLIVKYQNIYRNHFCTNIEIERVNKIRNFVCFLK